MLLLVDVETDRGEKFPCAVDTGSPNTVLPARLEPMLGRRSGARRFSTLDRPNEVEHVYTAPKLYLVKTRLLTGAQVGASGTLGILGMDCLRHYCIQLDFEARTVRFLASDQLKTAELGKPFSLSKSRYAAIKHEAFFQDEQADLLIDTGCPFDGYVTPRAFKLAVREQHGQSLPLLKEGVVRGAAPGMALFSECVWDGESYTNLIIGKRFNLVGLRFLGRHLVTFDFPKGTLYLRRAGADGAPKTVLLKATSANVGAANGGQPIRSETNSTSSAAGSRR